MPRKIVSTWWRKYNPILQKPTSLEPIAPWGWSWYYGPDPAAGCSYGQYHDDDNGFDILTEKAHTVYSPATGQPMVFVSDVPFEEVQKKVATAKGATVCSSMNCASCEASLVADFDLADAPSLYCCRCGEVLRQLGINKEGKTMRTASVSQDARLQKLKAKIRANLLQEGEKPVAATAEVAKSARLAEIRKRAHARIAARRAEQATAQEERVSDTVVQAMAKKETKEEWISIDTIVQAMEEEEAKEACDEAKMECEDEAKLEGEEAAAPAADEAKPEDEFIDIDMVLSMLKRKEHLAKARAARAKAATVKAEEAAPAVAPAPVAPAAVEPEPDMIAQENPLPEAVDSIEESAEEEKAEEAAMKYEPLASLAALRNVKKDQIEMLLYAEHTENPFWNVMVSGTPVARVQLQSQMAPEEIKAVFISEDYASDLAEHCEKTGFVETMKKVNAEFWANHTSNAKVAAHYQVEAQTKFEDERKKHLASFKNDFVSCLNIVQAGLTKNFYPEVGNPLKDALFANLTLAGLPEETAVSVIEKSFGEGSPTYFRSLFDKAEEYMSHTKETRAELAKAISNSNSLVHTDEPVTLQDRLARASAIAQVSGSPSLQVSAVTIDSNAFKAQLKGAWRK